MKEGLISLCKNMQTEQARINEREEKSIGQLLACEQRPPLMARSQVAANLRFRTGGFLTLIRMPELGMHRARDALELFGLLELAQ